MEKLNVVEYVYELEISSQVNAELAQSRDEDIISHNGNKPNIKFKAVIIFLEIA